VKALIWAGCQLIATLLIWGVALGTELVIESGRHLPAGLTITPHHGHRNFAVIIIAIVGSFLFGVFSAMRIGFDLDVKVEAKK
jgi:hypothetical protein